MASLQKQLEFLVPRLNALCHVAHAVDMERVRYPLFSIFALGCMEKGQDFLVGGQWSYKIWDWKDRDHVDVGDSLSVLVRDKPLLI